MKIFWRRQLTKSTKSHQKYFKKKNSKSANSTEYNYRRITNNFKQKCLPLVDAT